MTLPTQQIQVLIVLSEAPQPLTLGNLGFACGYSLGKTGSSQGAALAVSRPVRKLLDLKLIYRRSGEPTTYSITVAGLEQLASQKVNLLKDQP